MGGTDKGIHGEKYNTICPVRIIHQAYLNIIVLLYYYINILRVARIYNDNVHSAIITVS